MSKDQDLKALFGQMAQQDLDHFTAPSFTEVIKEANPKAKPLKSRVKVRPLWYYSAAVAAAICLGYFVFASPGATPVNALDYDLSLEVMEPQPDPLLTDNSSLFLWESSTDFLIKDFND